MNFTVYHRNIENKLAVWDVTFCENHLAAINLVKKQLDDGEVPYINPILCLIQGGKQ
jgi:hypothetical protein